MKSSVLLLAALLWSVLALSESQNPFQRPECKGVIHGKVFEAGEPKRNVKVVAWPLGIDLAVILPEAQTDQAGEYLFQNVCPGRYTVVIDDTYSSPGLNEFLYGSPVLEVRLTDTNPEAELPYLSASETRDNQDSRNQSKDQVRGAEVQRTAQSTGTTNNTRDFV
jgi:hypothetical protein